MLPFCQVCLFFCLRLYFFFNFMCDFLLLFDALGKENHLMVAGVEEFCLSLTEMLHFCQVCIFILFFLWSYLFLFFLYFRRLENSIDWVLPHDRRASDIFRRGEHIWIFLCLTITLLGRFLRTKWVFLSMVSLTRTSFWEENVNVNHILGGRKSEISE